MVNCETGMASLIEAIRAINDAPEGPLPLHAPVFAGNEKKYVLDTIDSTYVSSVGKYVTRFEELLREKTGSRFAIACVNGTAALEMALRLAGVGQNDLVVTQAISFVATANAIAHCMASPVFCDVDADCLGLSPESLEEWLKASCHMQNGQTVERSSGKRVAACVPMHAFGLPARIERIMEICAAWNIPVVEDAAEALGSICNGRACGTFGLMGTLSFNGNKVCTTGGGGAILTNDGELAKKAHHLTTTAKQPHSWRFYHDEVAWNYRLPNINAALGCAQLEQLDEFTAQKRKRARAYMDLFSGSSWRVLEERPGCLSNYWLPVLVLDNAEQKEMMLEAFNKAGIQLRPLWEPLPTLPMYKYCLHSPLPVSIDMASRVVNLPNGCHFS